MSDRSTDEILQTLEGLGSDHIKLKSRNEEALRLREVEFHTLAESMPQIVWATRPDGWNIYFNQQWVEYTGLTLEQSCGEGWIKPFHPEDQPKALSAWEEATKRNGTYNIECRLRRRDGVYRWFLVRGVPHLDEQGNIIKWYGTCTDIENQKQAESEIQAGYDLLNKLTEQVPGVVYQYRLYPDGRSAFPISSSGMWDIYEVTPEEVREDATPVFSRIHPDDYDMIGETISESARNQTLYQSEFRVILPKQGLRWVHCNAKPTLLEDGSTLWYGIITDITERKLSEEKIKESEERYRAVAESAKDAIISIDSQGTVIGWNRGAEVIFGYSSEEMTGESLSRIMPIDFMDHHPGKIERVVQGGEPHVIGNTIQLVGLRKSGQEFPIELSLGQWETASGKFFTGIIRDITERDRYRKELVEARDKAEESDRLKSAFLSNMSHEIRTPMNGILGFTDLLDEPGLSGEEKSRYIDMIKKGGDRLLHIINDIISISKIESGQMEKCEEETCINDQIEFMHSFFKSEAKQKNIALSFSTGLANDDSVIKTDPEKIYAILTNLIKNALKFTPSGSVEFGYEKINQDLRFYVRDSGIGIGPEKRDMIFERFRQEDETFNRRAEGSGLGLAISKAYVEILGGKIWVKSEAGVGSTFYFTVPYLK